MLPLRMREPSVSRRLYHPAARGRPVHLDGRAGQYRISRRLSRSAGNMINYRTALVALASSCVCWLVAALVPIPRAGGSPAAPTVGVVVFYAPTPLPIVPGVTLEPFAADDLSRLLARSAPGRLTVIPAPTMRQAEGKMR